jgi:hypothetical protein
LIISATGKKKGGGEQREKILKEGRKRKKRERKKRMSLREVGSVFTGHLPQEWNC